MKKLIPNPFFFLLVSIIWISNIKYGLCQYLQINTEGNVEMLIIDPQGRKLGYDPYLNKRFNEIPFSGIGAATIDTHTEDGPEDDPNMPDLDASISRPTNGNYQILLTGTRLAVCGINPFAEHEKGPVTNTTAWCLIDSNDVVTFHFRYNYKNKDSTFVQKVVDLDQLRQDLVLSRRIGWITDEELYDQLQEAVDELEEELEEEQDPEEVLEALNEFSEILQAPSESIQPDAVELLMEDTRILKANLPQNREQENEDDNGEDSDDEDTNNDDDDND